MKTKVLSILAVLMLIITMSYAQNPQKELQNTINKSVTYPVTAREKSVEGSVFVEFTVKDDGSIEVTNCFSVEGELQSYVFNKFSEIKVTPDAEIVGKSYTMRLDFDLI